MSLMSHPSTTYANMDDMSIASISIRLIPMMVKAYLSCETNVKITYLSYEINVKGYY